MFNSKKILKLFLIFELLLDKMNRYSPKIEIINHFDNLINRVDIDIDSSLEKFNDQQLISELLKSCENDRNCLRNDYVFIQIFFFSHD